MTWIFLSLMLVAACKKENADNDSPIIQIESPLMGSMFYYLNNIEVSAAISDNQQLTSVTLEITNAGNIRYLEHKEFSPMSREFRLDYTLSHNDLYLTSGVYYIKITASDGTNETIVFREIQLTEAPRILERIIVVRESGSSTALDTLQNSNLLQWTLYSDPYEFGGIDSRTRQLVICGSQPSAMQSLILDDLQPLNAAFPPTNETITAFIHDETHHSFFWGTQQGNLWKTTNSGTQLFASATNSPIRHLGIHFNKLIAASDNSIYVIRKDNGITETVLSLNWQLKGIISLPSDESRVLLVGNENNTSKFKWLNLSTAAFNDVFNFYDTSPVSVVCKGGGNNFYALHVNGLAHYSNLMDNYTINPSIQANKLIFDELNQLLYSVNSNEMVVLSESGQQVLHTISAPGAQDVWLQYNK